MKNGGPAFPCEGGDMSGLIADPGMSLRDWFAGQAMGAVCVNMDSIKRTANEHGVGAPQLVAEISYQIADAMLAAGEGGV